MGWDRGGGVMLDGGECGWGVVELGWYKVNYLLLEENTTSGRWRSGGVLEGWEYFWGWKVVFWDYWSNGRMVGKNYFNEFPAILIL